MNKVVLDASALLATLLSEPGGDMVEKLLLDPAQLVVMSAVNWCEVFDRLLRDGFREDQVSDLLRGLNAGVIDFTRDHAKIAAGYRLVAPWLSLGDRACLALAATLQAAAWTTDRLWSRVNLPIRVEVLR